jgi:hypothetical protein
MNAAVRGGVVDWLGTAAAEQVGMTETLPVDRARVWTYLTERHPEFALRLRDADVREWGTVTLRDLPDGTRRFLWDLLRERYPAMAALLAGDPVIAGLRETFGGTPTFRVEFLVDAIAGRLEAEAAGPGGGERPPATATVESGGR